MRDAPDWSAELEDDTDLKKGLAKLARRGTFQLVSMTYAEDEVPSGPLAMFDMTFRFVSVHDLDGALRKLVPPWLREGLADIDVRVQVRGSSRCRKP